MLETVLSSAYSNIEAQLGTTMGLEFIRVRQALQDNVLMQHGIAPAGMAPLGPLPALPPAAEGAVVAEGGGSSPEVEGRPAGEEGSGGSGSSAVVLRPQAARASPTALERAWRACRLEHGEYVLGRVAPRVNPDRPPDFPCISMLLKKGSGPATAPRVYFGDVPIGTTVRRCWGVLSFRQKVGRNPGRSLPPSLPPCRPAAIPCSISNLPLASLRLASAIALSPPLSSSAPEPCRSALCGTCWWEAWGPRSPRTC